MGKLMACLSPRTDTAGIPRSTNIARTDSSSGCLETVGTGEPDKLSSFKEG